MTDVIAALGPTNTGKTHRAIERMLQFESGMIGLPLRLLAREVYDRVSARLGEGAVALLTGEERRIPKDPAYWICTVEAMPLQRRVDFLAVDEIQLAAHSERGHVFTDRLLHARGLQETWFLGSDTMGPLLRTFVPESRFDHFTRFSALRGSGRCSLRSLPARSVVVAFSVAQVYELAERLRRLRGGVAVVLGALSPRTRNAQVAMYQAGEVQYLVATDAIGMGLNLDVNHVAFASLSKFDGRQSRNLHVDELAQIAGRAGRHVRDGTFGTLKPLDDLPSAVVEAIETHRFPKLQRLIYRNSTLNFSSLENLKQSLCEPPPHPALQRIQQAEDYAVLMCLVESGEVAQLAATDDARRLLWELCQVPNFSKQLPGHHADRLRPLYGQLMRAGALDADRFARQLDRLSEAQGDIATLTGRLESIRTYSYLCHRKGWLRDGKHFQERTAHIEQRLGDALHQRLVERFVSGDNPRRRRRSKVEKPACETRAQTEHPFAKLATLQQSLFTGAEDSAELESEQAFVARLESAEHRDFDVDRHARITFAGERIGRLVAGKELSSPGIAVSEPEVWTAGAQTRIKRRLRAFAGDVVYEVTGARFNENTKWQTDHGRGLAYTLAQNLGMIPVGEAETQLAGLSTHDQLRFAKLGLQKGRFAVYLAGAVGEQALLRRVILADLQQSGMAKESSPPPWMGPAAFVSAGVALQFGYVQLGSQGSVALRALEDLDRASRNPDLKALLATLEHFEFPPRLFDSVLHALYLQIAETPMGPQLTRTYRHKKRRRKPRSRRQ